MNGFIKSGVSVSLLLAGSFLTTSCSAWRPPVNVAAEEAAIRKLTLDWCAAEASNNVDSALAFLADNATMQPPNSREIQGHAAIRAGYESVKFVSLRVGATKVAVSAAGDLATIWGPLTVVIAGPNGPITLDQKFVATWQKRAGTWQVIENSWSDNAASPTRS
jgi:ketosteroid isomerase-like protein